MDSSSSSSSIRAIHQCPAGSRCNSSSDEAACTLAAALPLLSSHRLLPPLTFCSFSSPAPSSSSSPPPPHLLLPAFLLDEPELIERLVVTLSTHLSVPVFVKMRVLPGSDGRSVDTAATVALAQRLEAAGCSLLTVHGRTRVQKCACEVDWATVAAVKQGLRIPVIANGGIERPEDLKRCLDATGCDAVMTSEGALENPSILSGVPTSRSGQLAVARQYVQLSRAHPPRAVAVLKAHFFKMLYMALDLHRDLRGKLGDSLEAEKVYGVVEELCAREEAAAAEAPQAMSARCDEEGAPWQTWYRRHRGEKEADPNRYGTFVPNTEEPQSEAKAGCGGDACGY